MSDQEKVGYPGQIWAAATYQWHLVAERPDGRWETDVRNTTVDGKDAPWQIGQGVPIKLDDTSLKLIHEPRWPPLDGDTWMSPIWGEMRFTGRGYYNDDDIVNAAEFYTLDGRRDGYGVHAVLSHSITFVRRVPVSWSDYIPKSPTPNTGRKIFKPGEVWATHFVSYNGPTALVWRVTRVVPSKGDGQWIGIVGLADINSPSGMKSGRIANSDYTNPAILVAEAACDPPDPDLIFQFLYK